MGEDRVETASLGSKKSLIIRGRESSLGVASTESIRTTKADVSVADQEVRKKESGSYVFKEFRSEETTETFLRHYQYLKKQGFPVPGTVRRIEGKNEVMVTDLSEGGKKRVVSVNEIAAGLIDSKQSIPNLERVKQELKVIAKKADELGILIAADAYFLIMDKLTNEAKLIIGDLGAGVMVSEEEKAGSFFDNSFEGARVFYQNIAAAFAGGNYFPDTSF